MGDPRLETTCGNAMYLWSKWWVMQESNLRPAD